jgi:hypothetical protein
MNRIFSTLVWAVLVTACSAPGRVAKLDAEPALDAPQIAERQAQLTRAEPMRPAPGERYDIVVIGGSCAPKPLAKFAVTACVNERPCNGLGLRGADGAVACACYEVRGGCEADTFCHLRSRSCTKLPAASYHVQ